MDHSSEPEAISETVVKYKVWKTHVVKAHFVTTAHYVTTRIS